MMYYKTNEMVEAINNEINYCLHEYKNNGRSDLYNRMYSRINAMIEMLRIVTNENYYFDENGLHYENGAIVTPLRSKRAAAIEGYTIGTPTAGNYNILVLRSDNCATEFEELNRNEMSILIKAFESDDEIINFVVADSHGVIYYEE